MSGKPQNQGAAVFNTEQNVADYLRQTPDFFDRHIYLLHTLKIPHVTGGTISLIERQVRVLREENRRLQYRLNEILEVVRKNDTLNARMQRLSLELIEAKGLDDALETIYVSLHKEFHADLSTLRLVIDDALTPVEPRIEIVPSNDPGMAMFRDLLNNDQPLCGRLRMDQLRYLFGRQAAKVRSAVLIPHCNPYLQGIIAIGSHDAGRFQPGMGTAFLSYLGEFIGRCLTRHLSLERLANNNG